MLIFSKYQTEIDWNNWLFLNREEQMIFFFFTFSFTFDIGSRLVSLKTC